MVDMTVAGEERASGTDAISGLHPQLAFICSKSTTETLEKGVKYV